MNILFLCTGNSCRSQMAEAFARLFLPPDAGVYSTGIEKHGLNPLMLRVMEEAGLNMKEHFSKTVDELPSVEWDLAVAVCSRAAGNCPYLRARRNVLLPLRGWPRGWSGKRRSWVFTEVSGMKSEQPWNPLPMKSNMNSIKWSECPGARSGLSCLDRYLTLWIFLAMGAGIGVGYTKVVWNLK